MRQRLIAAQGYTGQDRQDRHAGQGGHLVGLHCVVVLVLALVVPLAHMAGQSELAMDVLAARLNDTPRRWLQMQASLYELALNITTLQSNDNILATGTLRPTPRAAVQLARARMMCVTSSWVVSTLRFLCWLSMLDQVINMASFGGATVFTIQFDAFARHSAFNDGSELYQDLRTPNIGRLYVDDPCLAAGTCGYQAHVGTTTIKYVSSNTCGQLQLCQPRPGGSWLTLA